MTIRAPSTDRMPFLMSVGMWLARALAAFAASIAASDFTS